MQKTTQRWLRHALAGGALVMATLASVGSAQADLITNWTNITNNGNQNVGGQLVVDATAVGLTQVNFRFSNNIGIASSITDIYFDDKTIASLMAPMQLAGSAGVAFSPGANPGNLPGGAPISFSADFSTDSNAPVSPNGINSVSEFLNVTFNLAPGRTFADIISQLNSGELVIGLHVQSIGTSGGSDSYVNGRTVPVPEPASLALFGAGLAGLGMVARRRRRSS